jgi:sec-independent protein translocase protein TatA
MLSPERETTDAKDHCGTRPHPFDTECRECRMELAGSLIAYHCERPRTHSTNDLTRFAMFSLFAYLPLPFAVLTPGTMLLVALVVLLLFGNRLPSVMRSLGKGVTEFKKGIEGVEDDVDNAVKKSESPKKVDEQTVKSWPAGEWAGSLVPADLSFSHGFPQPSHVVDSRSGGDLAVRRALARGCAFIRQAVHAIEEERAIGPR